MAESADGFPAMAALFVSSLSSALYCPTLTMMQRGNNINSNGSLKIHNTLLSRVSILSSPGPIPLSPKPKYQIPRGLGLTLKSYGPPPHPPHPPLTFRGSECAYMVQIDALSTPECQKGVPSHSRGPGVGVMVNESHTK